MSHYRNMNNQQMPGSKFNTMSLISSPRQINPQVPSVISPVSPMNLPIGLPTGIPTGPSVGPQLPTDGMNIPMGGVQIPQTVQSPMYTPGFLSTQIGRKMRVEFLIGTNGPLVDRTGTLIGVGASYILLQPIETDDVLLCDIYSIKFVTILL